MSRSTRPFHFTDIILQTGGVFRRTSPTGYSPAGAPKPRFSRLAYRLREEADDLAVGRLGLLVVDEVPRTRSGFEGVCWRSSHQAGSPTRS